MDDGLRVELEQRGYCVVAGCFSPGTIAAARNAFWPVLLAYLAAHLDAPNRGPHRHFLPMSFSPPAFAAEFFFHPAVLELARSALGARFVADQWGCDVPLRGSTHQGFHADYQRPLFEELPDLDLPPYMLVASFGLGAIGIEDGPIEIAAGTHLMPRADAMRAVESGAIASQPVPLAVGDVLVRHPWTLHRGTPNITDTPRALVTVRYVRRWFADESRDVCVMPSATWRSLTPEQQAMMRFPVGG